MTTVLLDSHVVHWWSAEPARISRSAGKALSEADELAVAAISWFELAWLAERERIVVTGDRCIGRLAAALLPRRSRRPADLRDGDRAGTRAWSSPPSTLGLEDVPYTRP